MARLSREKWLKHGLETLASEGFTSLKADTLAKSLGVSRGSFYWHFTDLAEFHQAVLHHYLEVSVLAVVGQLEAEGTSAAEKIRALIDISVGSDRRIEQAMRAWAFSEPNVHELMAELDRQRLAYLGTLAEELGLDPESARRRALLLYLSNVGYFMISDIIDPELERATLTELAERATSIE